MSSIAESKYKKKIGQYVPCRSPTFIVKPERSQPRKLRSGNPWRRKARQLCHVGSPRRSVYKGRRIGVLNEAENRRAESCI